MRLTIWLMIHAIIIALPLTAQESVHVSPDLVHLDWPSQVDNSFIAIALQDIEYLNQGNNRPFAQAYTSYYIGETRSEELLLEQIQTSHNPVDKAYAQYYLADYYYERSKFDDAYYYYSQLNYHYLSEPEAEYLFFKKGYMSLINKQFDQSISDFSYVLEDSSTVLDKDALYYTGIAKYFLNEDEKAIVLFQKVASSPPYNNLIPYYISQIYFKQAKYDEVIQYASQYENKAEVRNRKEIKKLIGQSYYKTKKYDKALDYLTEYEASAEKLTKSEFYQIAYTYYELKKYNKAIPIFLEISNVGEEMGQMVNYYLADCYQEMFDLNSALSALSKVRKSNYNQTIQQQADINYAKLSYKLGNERAAINILANLPSNHRHYTEGQNLLSDILVRTDDHVMAMTTIEALEQKTPALLKTYQRLAYQQGTKNHIDGNIPGALSYYKRAIETPGEAVLALDANYWIASILYDEGQKSRSEQYLVDYFDIQSNQNITSPTFFLAKYLNAYLAFEQENFTKALSKFQSAENYYDDSYDKQMYYDVLMRIGDCNFIKYQYAGATTYFTKANNSSNQHADYAAFQIANLLSAKRKYIDANIAYENVYKQYPESIYWDDALFGAGESYMAVNRLIPALKSFQKIIDNKDKADQYYAKSLLRAGLISYNFGDVKNALKSYQELFQTQSNPEEKKEALLALEEIYLNDLNDPQSYFEFAKNVAGLTINDFEKDSISYSVALEKFKNGQYRESIISFDKYASTFPSGYYISPSYYFKGEAAAYVNEFDIALEAYEAVIQDKNSSNYKRALKKAALIAYNHTQDYTKSYTYFDLVSNQVLTPVEEREVSIAALESAYLTNNQAGVEKYINQSLQLTGWQPEERAKLHYYNGMSLYKQSKIDEAIKSFNEVIRNSKGKQAAEVSYLIATIFYDRGEYAKAEQRCLETTKRAAQYPEWVAKSLILLSKSYVKQNDNFNARAAAEAVIDHYKDDAEITQQALDQIAIIDELERTNNRVKSETDNNTLELDTLKRN